MPKILRIAPPVKHFRGLGAYWDDLLTFLPVEVPMFLELPLQWPDVKLAQWYYEGQEGQLPKVATEA